MKRTIILTIVVLALGVLVWSGQVSEAGPMGTAFTYQGRLIDANIAADEVYDFNFGLYDRAIDGNQLGGDVNVPDVDVIDGYFTVALDFGSSVFSGDARWLKIGVRPGDMNDPNVYTTLSPRQKVTPTPYAMYAKRAGGDNDWMVSGNDMYSIPSGNVAVGESNPLAKLHVAGNVILEGASPVLLSLSDLVGAGDVGVEFTTSLPGSKKWAMMRDGTSGGFLIQESFPYPPFLGGTLFMESGTGNVGIGTKYPEKLLQIVNKEGGYDGLGITLDPHGGGFAGGTTWDIDNDDGAFKLTESRALPGYPKTRLTIFEGNVGIGTTSPGATLDVNGTLAVQNGPPIDEISTDGTLDDNSDSAVPTEKAVKTYVDSQVGSVGVGVVPIGGVTAWMKSFPNTPSLPDGWLECNGQTLSDSNSPYDGQTIPNLNGDSGGAQRFLRGATTSGGTGGSDTNSHTHQVTVPNSTTDGSLGGPGGGYGTFTTTSPSDENNMPAYYETVWIMKVK